VSDGLPSERAPAPELGLFDGVLARGEVRAEVSDRAWLQAMLDVEAALGRACASVGLVPAEQADAIAARCRAESYDVAALGAAAAASGNPVVPLVAALRQAVGEPAASAVHLGATSQDVLDTAAMLVTRRALGPLLADLRAAAGAAARLAVEHRDTLMVGRTLLQPALPITFGLKAAGWLSGLDAATGRLAALRRTGLAVQYGGAAGTLAALGDAGPAVLAALAADLDLPEPALPWHTDRARIGDLAGALGVAAGVAGKVARDVVLLAQAEVAEVTDSADRGGSSTLPHKRNPIAAVAVLAAAAAAPGLVSTLLAAMVQEHERAAGGWQAEWGPLSDLLRGTGSAAAWLRDCLAHLRVHPDAMRSTVDGIGPDLVAERLAGVLAGQLGKAAANAAVRRAARSGGYDDLVATLGDEQLLDPAGYLGSAGVFVDRALHAHRLFTTETKETG
jgi:3-carboxy-cis,cis-muconate cycloisomerase